MGVVYLKTIKTISNTFQKVEIEKILYLKILGFQDILKIF